MDTIRRTLLRWIRYVPMVSMVDYVVKIPLPNQFGERDFRDCSLEKAIRQVVWQPIFEPQ